MAKLAPKLSEKQISDLKAKLKKPTDPAELKRVQAVLMLNLNEPIGKIEDWTNLKRSRIYSLRSLYLAKGLKALETKPKKVKALLTRKQLKEIESILKTKTPEDFDYACSFWTTSILADWIYRTYDVHYKSRTSLYLIFKEAKFTYHKPGRVYEKHDDQAIIPWQTEVAPKITQALGDPATVILAEDEMILSTQTTFQKIWLPEGEYPKIAISNTRKNRSIYGFLNIKTGIEHAWKTDWQNMFITVKILKKLRKIYPTQKLLIIWDGAGWHRGSEVKKFMQKDQRLETIHFPRYSPELNPQEHVWKSGRSQITHNRFIANIDQATDEFVAYLNKTKFPYSLAGFSPLVGC